MPADHPWRKYPDRPSDVRAENPDSAGEIMRLLEGCASRKVSVALLTVEGVRPISYTGTIASLRHLLLRLENRGPNAPELAVISAD